MVSLTNGSASARTVGMACSLYFFFLSLLHSFLFNHRLSKTHFVPCKAVFGFFFLVVYFFFSLLYSLLFNHRLSKTRFAPCKVVYGFFFLLCIFFFHCSTLSFSTTDYLKHVLHLVKSFMDFFFFVAQLSGSGLSLLYSLFLRFSSRARTVGMAAVVSQTIHEIVFAL